MSGSSGWVGERDSNRGIKRESVGGSQWSVFCKNTQKYQKLKVNKTNYNIDTSNNCEFNNCEKVSFLQFCKHIIIYEAFET